jgi:hypothetical protein
VDLSPRPPRRAGGLHALAGGALAAVLASAVLSGCGLAVGPAPSEVQLLVTSEFGGRVVLRRDGLRARGGETVLGLLRASGAVATAAGAVVSVDGVSAASAPHGPHGGNPQGAGAARWSYYVNGVQAAKPPGAVTVRPGDHVWWDLHEAGGSPSAPAAVVGAYPQPFLDGIEGRRLPVRIECTSAGGACDAVAASLRRAGVPAALAAVGSGGAPETLRVIVGPWAHIDGDIEAQRIALGLRVSGVYARFSNNGRTLELLDEQGRAVRALASRAGLVAATQRAKEAPVWVVTGTDAVGVALAAHAFDVATLARRFAVALRPGATIALPLRGRALRRR